MKNTKQIIIKSGFFLSSFNRSNGRITAIFTSSKGENKNVRCGATISEWKGEVERMLS